MNELEMNIPALRFPEFEEEWELKKLGDVTTYVDYRGKAPIKTDNGCFLVTAKNIKKGFIDYECSKEYVSEDDYFNVMSKGLPEVGDVLFTTEAPMGNVAQVDNKNIALAQRVIKFSGKDCLRNSFLLHYMLSDNFQKSISEKAIGTTVQGISGGELHRINISFPSLGEQEKVAGFHSAVNEKLHQLKQEKAHLVQYKKGVMQQIFNQEIRFKDDNGNEFPEWEEKSLGEVSTIKRGASPRPITNPIWFDDDSKIGWVRISDVTKSNKFLEKTEQYLSKDGVSKSRLVTKGNLIMSICATIGKPIYTNFDVCIHDGFIVFENLTLDKEYLFYYLDMIQLNWYKYGQPGTQVNLNSEIVSNETIPFPCQKEQIKIASFLSAIDENITNITNQIAFTEQWKKGLLQKMFV